MTDDVDVQPWYEIPRSEWTLHDWLYAAAAELGKAAGDESEPPATLTISQAMTIVMDFADENCEMESKR